MPGMRTFRTSALLAVLASILTACSQAVAPGPSASTPAKPVASTRPSASAPPKVTLRSAVNGTQPTAGYLWVIQDAGIFEQHGVHVDFTTMNGAAAIAAMVSGGIDFGVHAGAQLPLTAFAQGTPLKLVAANEDVFDLKFIAPNSVTSFDQLRGKKIGAQSFSSLNAGAERKLLSEHGLQVDKDYQLIETGSSGSDAGIAAQMASHNIDAAAFTAAFASQLLAQGGYHELADLAQTDIHVASEVLAFPASYVQQHPDVVQRTVDAMIDGIHYFKTHEPDAITAYKTHYQLDDQAAMDALWQRQSQVLSKTPTINKADLADLISQLPSDTPTVTDDKLNQLVDDSFVEDATKRGLTNY